MNLAKIALEKKSEKKNSIAVSPRTGMYTRIAGVSGATETKNYFKLGKNPENVYF